MDSLFSLFWSNIFWLPKSTTWEQYESIKDIPTVKDVSSLPFILAFAIMFVKYISETYVFPPIGLLLGVPPPPFASVEGGTPTLTKFSQHAFRALAFGISGLHCIMLRNSTDSFFDVDKALAEYPSIPVTYEIKVHYIVILAFYWCLTFTQFTDIRRKDAMQIFIHHINALLLIYISWISNYVRIGLMVLYTHDNSTCALEISRIITYCGHVKGLIPVTFVLFLTQWVYLRVFIYSLYVVKGSAFLSHADVKMPHSFTVCVALLLIQLLLNIRWTYDIINLGFKSFKSGKPCFESGSQQEISSKKQKQV